jgi:type IV pilus assembly protein PilM
LGLFSRDTSYFGLDIGASAIRLVQLRENPGQKPSLVAFGSIDSPPGLFESDAKVDWSKISELVKTLVRETKIQTKGVVAALPGSVAFTTVVKMPKMSKSEAAKAIQYQAEQYIPMALDEVRLDWHVIQGADPNQVEVLMVAAPIHWVNKYTSILEGAGLTIHALEVNPIAAARSLVAPGAGEVIIVDIGRTTTDISVVANSVVRHIRSVPVGGAAMTRAITQRLSVDEAQAEGFKTKFGLESDKLDGAVASTLAPVVDSILQEVDRSRKYYQSELAGGAVAHCILCGGVANLPGLAAYVSRRLNMSVQLGNPWAEVNFPAQIQSQLQDVAQNYPIAVGLAMRGEQ